jgi:hypothetical protein
MSGSLMIYLEPERKLLRDPQTASYHVNSSEVSIRTPRSETMVLAILTDPQALTNGSYDY